MNEIFDENSLILEVMKAGSEISGTLIGGTVFDPEGLVSDSVISPIILKLFSKVVKEAKKWGLSDRGESRIGFACTVGLHKIKAKLENGEKLRTDDFFESDKSNRSTSEEILEGVLRSVHIENQEKKLQFYGNFLSNLAFDSSINKDKAHHFSKAARILSYQQLCILQFVSQHGITWINWMYNFNRTEEIQAYSSLEPCIDELEIYKLLYVDRMQLGVISRIGSSKLGIEFTKLMELYEIDVNDIKSLEEDLSKVKEIIKRPDVVVRYRGIKPTVQVKPEIREKTF